MPHSLSSIKHNILSLILGCLCFLHFIPSCVQAQVFNSSISTATGGTGRAAVEPGDALLLNSATLPHLQGRFLFTSVAQDEFVVSLSDNTKESTLPAGLSYVEKKSERTIAGVLSNYKFSDIAITLADFIVDKWSVGLVGHYITQSLNQANYIHTNTDLGFLFTPNPNLGVGLVFYNLFGEKADLPREIREKNYIGAGVNYIYHDTVRFRLDGTSEAILGVGIETYLNRFIITRFGYSNDFDDQRQLLAAGVGFNGPRFQLNYAYAGNTQKSSDYRHSVDMVIPF